MTNRSNKWIKKAFQRLRNDFGGHCRICGTTEDLQFAHIRDNGFSGSGRGRKERYYNIKNNPSDYALLCKTCHREFDNLRRKNKFHPYAIMRNGRNFT